MKQERKMSGNLIERGGFQVRLKQETDIVFREE